MKLKKNNELSLHRLVGDPFNTHTASVSREGDVELENLYF